MPAVPAAGVPLNVPVPLPLSTNVTPAGRLAPPRASDGGGKPVVVTVKLPGVPTRKVVVLALVIDRRLLHGQRERLRGAARRRWSR